MKKKNKERGDKDLSDELISMQYSQGRDLLSSHRGESESYGGKVIYGY